MCDVDMVKGGGTYAGRLGSERAGMACRVAANAAMKRSTPQYIKLVYARDVDRMRLGKSWMWRDVVCRVFTEAFISKM